MSLPCALAALSLIAITWSACATSAPPASTTVRGEFVVAPAVAAVPSGPAAEFYSTEGSATVTNDPLASRLAAEVDEIRKQHGHAPVQRDGRLDRVAVDIAVATKAIRMPSREAVVFLLSHYGLVEPESNLFLVNGDEGGEASSLADLRAQLEITSSPDWRREGIGIFRTPGKWSAVLVYQEKNFQLDPVARRLASRGHSKIVGRMLPMYHSPQVLFTSPRGEVSQIDTKVKDGTFAARFDCNRGDGTYTVEVTVVAANGPKVLTNLPVYCGVAPPAAFTAEEPAGVRTLDPSEAEAQLLEQLDRDRKASGLPALVRDPRLAKVARRHSDEMAENGEIAHYSRKTGSAIDRVVTAGVLPEPTIIAENVSADRSAADAERGFMASPGHRNNILNRELTHVGVGVAVGHKQAGTVLLYFTQVFAGWGQ